MTYEVILSRAAKRALADDLPEPVAAACFAFVFGPLAEHPRRVGQPLRPPLEPLYSARRGEFRVIYEIDDAVIRVLVLKIQHRRDAYRTP
ncbi:MAG: type II toxin-antitoxin system RelE/ParE family toxin [Propionibacteriaceae bacterium]|nr:type II toxin-antitoxin system RelE/ParE family toxin [Propionibacteriaceae bacterium]